MEQNLLWRQNGETQSTEHRAQSEKHCDCLCLGLALPKSSRGVRSTGNLQTSGLVQTGVHS